MQELKRYFLGSAAWVDFEDAAAAHVCHMAGGLQSQVNVQPAPAVAGDFCSNNPRFTFDAGPGGLVAAAAGLTVGRFCWLYNPNDPDGGPTQASNLGPGMLSSGTTGLSSGTVGGFVGRNQQGLNTTYLSDAAMTIPSGFPVTVYTGGDFWVKNDGTSFAQIGQKAYANFADGRCTFAASGSPNLGVTITGSISAQTTTFTGSITGDVLTVTALTTGTLYPGAILTGGTGIVTGTQVISQVSGTTGGVGTYLVNYPEQMVASAALTGTYGLLNATTVSAGTVGVGQILSGTGGGGVTTGTLITALGTGQGGTGTYVVSPSQTVTTNPSITGQTNVETKWMAMSTGLAGELVKISSHQLSTQG
jgi:hypothetical protein